MKKICIFGDSWACGEWNNGRVVHTGLEFLLGRTHQVVNLGQGGLGNKQAINRLSDTLKETTFDFIFWFETDSLRNASTDFFKQTSLTFQELVQQKQTLQTQDYKALNSLGVQVHAIGGAQKLNVPLISKFKNLNPYIPSLTELLLPSYTHPEIWCSTSWLQLVDRQFDLSSLDQLIACKRMRDSLKNHETLFWPDGQHPNRQGYKILYRKILKDFDL